MTDQRYMRPGLDFAVGKAVEELGELQSALGKTLRWGWTSVNPELPKAQQEPNVSWVRREIADVRGALDNLEREMASAKSVVHGQLPLTAPEMLAALKAAAQRLDESGTGEMGLLDTIHAVYAIIKPAISKAETAPLIAEHTTTPEPK